MTDIVERLRAMMDDLYSVNGAAALLVGEAAAEIERLRALLAEARDVIGNDVGPYGDELRDRIERALERKP